LEKLGSSIRTTRGHLIFFLLICSGLYAAATLLLPPYFPLLEADSASYLNFASHRTAIYPIFLRGMTQLGLSIEQIVYVQTFLFSLALMTLLAALLRAGVSRILVLFVTIALAVNGYFSSFHHTIMSESVFYTVMAPTVAFWIDYLRTGRAVFLVIVGLGVGLLIGIRPAGIVLVPMLLVSVWLKWRKRDVSAPFLAAALVLPLTMGPLAERLLHRAEHGDGRASVVTASMLGKAAMLVREDTVFVGPNHEVLNKLGKQLTATYLPVHEFLAGLPSLAAYPVVTAGYEATAQFSVFGRDLEAAASQSGVSDDVLAYELGKQSILANFPSYLRLSMLNYVGQWSIMALKVPPIAEAVNTYVASYPKVPLDGVLGDVILRPTASARAYVVYPAFLAAGIVTIVASLALVVFMVRPELGDEARGQYLMLAAFFAATCQSYTLLMSFINVPTPRYLMAVYPQLVLVAVFLISAFLYKSQSTRRNVPLTGRSAPIARLSADKA
jgi:hypothetical protein